MTNSKQLLQQALSAQLNAYAPYSGFTVGAAILTPSGKIFCGCNVENASYPCGTCAEAGAIAAMIAGGERQIAEILICANDECLLPCGNCLQKIAEFALPDTLVHCANLDKIVQTYRLTELLPHRFYLENTTNDR